MAKINSLNPGDPVWSKDSELDEKLKREIENLYPEVGAK